MTSLRPRTRCPYDAYPFHAKMAITPRRWAKHAAVLLPLMSIACEKDATLVDESPTVAIDQIVLEGLQENDFRAVVRATDDRSLDSAHVSLDGVHHSGYDLVGPQDVFEIVESGLPSGPHRFDIRVSDHYGNTTNAIADVNIPELTRLYDADVFIVNGDEVVPASGKEFCVGGVCGTTGPDGSVLLREPQPPYELNIIEGAHPSYVVAVGSERLEKNVINYGNGNAMLNEPLIDPDVNDATNTRTIVYWESDAPNQQIIDDFHGHFGNWNFWHTGHSLEVDIDTVNIDPDPMLVDTLLAAIQRGVDYANDIYERGPWKEPHTYNTVTYEGKNSNPILSDKEPGSITITPNSNIGFRVGGRTNPDGPGTITLAIDVDITHQLGDEIARAYVEKAVGGWLTGVIGLAPAGTGVFMEFFGRNPDLERRWTVLDRQASLLSTLFDSQSSLIPTGHTPDIAPASEAEYPYLTMRIPQAKHENPIEFEYQR